MESAHGYQVATRTDVASVANGSQWLAGPSLVERCKHLLAVCSAGAGYDVIDVEACTRAGIAVCNNSGPGAEAVAEHALGFMLDLAKKITVADRVLRGGELGDRLALRGTQLLGKTLGVIGLGAIGSQLGGIMCAVRNGSDSSSTPTWTRRPPEPAASNASACPNSSNESTSSR